MELLHYFITENATKKAKTDKYTVVSSKADVEKKLKEKTFKVMKNAEGKADFWQSYQLIVDEKNKPTNYVQCKFCNRIDEYDTSKGIKGLKAHTARCNSLAASSSMKSFIQKDIILSKDEKASLNMATLEFCYKDIRPFTAINGEGLHSLLLAISKLSSKYGQFSEEQLNKHLLCANSVS